MLLLRGVDTLMHIMSHTQFFRTTNGIQSRSDALDASRFVVNFLTILGVTEMQFQVSSGREIPES